MLPTLVFDADDTLWDEQGVLQGFEAAVEALLDDLTGLPSGFRERFIATENENIPSLGYGFSSYLYSVAEVISAEPIWHAHKGKVLDLVARLVSSVQAAGPTVIEGVRPTLASLRRHRYRMVLMTRGVEYEQRHKLASSGLSPFFSDVRVVARKDVDTYRSAATDLGDPGGASLCMIGNSMRSDVTPALEAGWGAIHVPPPTEWAHDADAATVSGRFRRARAFTEVAELVRCTDLWG